MMDDYDDGVIEVQVIPQDDNWGETATTITGKVCFEGLPFEKMHLCMVSVICFCLVCQ